MLGKLLPAVLALALVVPAAAAADGPGFDPFAPSPVPAVDFCAFGRRLTALEERVAALEGKGVPAAPVSPDALKVPGQMAAARAAGPVCGCAGSACPTPGFCGGAGCSCATARGVAAAPFVQARSATPGTTAPTAAGASTSRPAPDPYPGLTYTAVPRATSGGTSGGCANGSCGTPQRAGLFRR